MSLRSQTAAIAAATLFLAACGEEKVSVYRVPREKDPVVTPVAAAAGEGSAQDGSGGAQDGSGGAQMANAAVPTADGGLAWDAPPSWTPKPASAMRKASYDAPGGCDLSVTAFPGDVGGELANVNRWREQVGLAPLGAAQLEASVSRVEANGLKVTVVELDSAGAKGMIGAIVPLGASTWFFKLSGPGEAVRAARGDFLGFVGTVRAQGAAMADTAVPAAGGTDLSWQAPSSWGTGAPSAMRKASFRVGAAGAACDLSVTAFPGDVGGELANVNRWRGQLGLDPLQPRDLEGAVSRFDANGLRFAVVDLRSGEAADAKGMIGAIVPFAGATWFFKLAGPAPAVAAAKPQFLAFLRTVRAP